ncbi:MAG TPA: hypothetical protein VF660_05325 [Actinomycetota bacterium]|jgi:uncharacterized repeat protein (TIGR01451 family)
MGVRRSGTKRISAAVSAAFAISALVAFQVSPSQADKAMTVSGPTVVSPDGATAGPGGTGVVNWPVCDNSATTNVQRWESEPSLAVSSANPDKLATAWIQGNNDGIVVGYSSDGGNTWGHAVPPTLACTGGAPYTSALDPWISFGPPSAAAPDGIAYLSSVVSSSEPPGSAIIVNRSLDAGQTWSLPVTLDDASDSCLLDCTEELDNSNVVADPYHSSFAYAAWAHITIGPSGFTSHEAIAHTEDGGATWSQPAVIPWSSSEDRIQGTGRLVVVKPSATNPNGELVDVFLEVPPFGGEGATPSGPAWVMASRSSDFGAHWTTPISVALADANVTPTLGVGASADGGTIYVTWERPETSGCPDPSLPCFSLMLAKSADGGVSWQEPARVGPIILGPTLNGNGPNVPAGPSIAVNNEGTVGIAFYDQRNDPATHWDPVEKKLVTVQTDYWLRHSHDGGQTWREDHLVGPFSQDVRAAKGDSRFKDYQGIAPVEGGFAIAFTQGNPVPTPLSDIVFLGVQTPAADLSLTKSGSPNPAHVGKRLTYTITVGNNGPDAATGATVEDDLPAAVKFVSVSPSQGSCTRAMRIVTCSLGTLAAGQGATVTIVVKPTTKGSITNLATVSASSPADPNAANNTATAITTVKP